MKQQTPRARYHKRMAATQLQGVTGQDRIWAWINNATAHVKCLSVAQALLAKTTWVGLVGTTPIRLYLQMATDRPLFCTLNNRGKRQYRKTYGKPRELSEKFAEYASIGLPAHKAAIEGNVQALEEIFLWKGTKGVPALDRNCATPLHLAARRSHAPAIKWANQLDQQLIPLYDNKFPCYLKSATVQEMHIVFFRGSWFLCLQTASLLTCLHKQSSSCLHLSFFIQMADPLHWYFPNMCSCSRRDPISCCCCSWSKWCYQGYTHSRLQHNYNLFVCSMWHLKLFMSELLLWSLPQGDVVRSG